MIENYMNSVLQQFKYYKHLGESTINQLDESQLFWQYNDDSNSISIIVNHLWGNMMSRWTNFLNSDGEKEWRQRDLEFEIIISNKQELLEKWDKGWNCLFKALAEINKDSFHKSIYIRNQEHTIVEAINRQLSHYSYHIGQIVYLGRMQKGTDWISLSIPKGKSQAYNADKFSKGRHKAHFTEEFLKTNDKK